MHLCFRKWSDDTFEDSVCDEIIDLSSQTSSYA
ncbi:hypothetical protein FVEN_g13073 [Fusarium venenatum]|nr:hypothetical protein FVEN_g13073 [Fusarium venenatum]